ncbi:MAG: hypothetical protein ACOZCO_07340 [Bacteroidota bacterium]
MQTQSRTYIKKNHFPKKVQEKKQTRFFEELDYYPFGQQMPGRNAGSTEYRYLGINGQEVEPEITGSNSHSSAEYWMYDSRLGRRWNLDPKPHESWSSYSCFANNPNIYADPEGDTLRLKVNKSNVNATLKAVKLFNLHFKGVYKLTYTKVKDAHGYNYQLNLVKIGDDSKLDNQKKEFINVLSDAISGKGVARQEIVEGHETVVGSWLINTIDISDIEKFGAKTGPTGFSVTAHELKEQNEKAKKGLLPGDMGKYKQDKSGTIISGDFYDSHQEGLKAENKVSGTLRDEVNDIYYIINAKGDTTGSVHVDMKITPLGEVEEVTKTVKK